MKKKLREEAGLTMVEMLAAVVILMLLSLMLGTGLQMALNSYQTVIAESEVDLLLSTAVNAIADDLRYARDVDTLEDVTVDGKTVCSDFTYKSDSFGDNIRLVLNDSKGGQIMANDMLFLSNGAYGNGGISYKEYIVTNMKVTHDENALGEIIFTIYLRVETTDGKISAETPNGGVTVRCMNPPIETTTP